MMRLYRKNKAEWDLVRLVHEHVQVQGATGRIAPHMIHYGNDTIEKALGKINRYSSAKRNKIIRRANGAQYLKCLLRYSLFSTRPCSRLLEEGLAGLFMPAYRLFMAFGEAKLLELSKSASEPAAD